MRRSRVLSGIALFTLLALVVLIGAGVIGIGEGIAILVVMALFLSLG